MMKLADILGKAKAEPESDEMEAAEETDEGTSDEEISAMRMFERATTPERKAEALKLFLKSCGVY